MTLPDIDGTMLDSYVQSVDQTGRQQFSLRPLRSSVHTSLCYEYEYEYWAIYTLVF